MLAGLTLFFFGGAVFSSLGSIQQAQQDQIEKPKIFQEAYPLISESDLYCSFFILEDELPQIKIIASERQEEKILLSDSDIFFIDKGKNDGLEVGQVFLILEIGPQIKSPVTKENYGQLAFKRGRASIVRLEETNGTAKIEKTCGQIMVGQFLAPFEEKEGLLGKDLGFEVIPEEERPSSGNLIYLQDGYNMIGPGHWALIDLGREDGVQIGQQMTVFKRAKEETTRQAIGNLIVIDTQGMTSTVKILSCSEAIELGDEVQIK